MTRTWYAEDSSGIHWLDHTLYDKCPECMKGRLPHVWALLLKAQPMWMVCVRVVLGTLAFVGIIIIVFAIAPGRKRHVADFDVHPPVEGSVVRHLLTMGRAAHSGVGKQN
eukprot:GEMP01098760.1.p2 GENE.GEMP01098760.1~~GEMP01098760.1.p2  ORF type:complete len:110 (+),score=23.24 GEMP01098760.1:158-487(+)